MPAAEVKNLRNNDSLAMTLWLKKMKSMPMQEDEEAKVVKKKMENKNSAENKKTCICAPTNHAGSFRCHLHRVNAAARKPSWMVEKDSNANFNLVDVQKTNKVDGHARISRFGRAASVRSSHDKLPISTMASAKPEEVK
ncbi:hypothetical protein FEM48_Zijuj09G0085400 [Ziziphus jujuba var. spinosa]|uniref:Uncharacterized protein n=1 Tax=Ziziphus jujuba var. spinosa TaxID=714518 RepID=A0A978URY3_ZIZJJ|nr:hypothetical protein FEM48_Zijuj09G0085400 [Ziziphus jujuba var. spinosa]